MSTDLLLTLKNLVVGYRDRPLSSPLTLSVPVGARVGIIGSNGTGKTTLVKTLLGLMTPLEGSCSWKEATSFGYVPQENQIDPLFPLTVEDLLKMGMKKSKTFEADAMRTLTELGLTQERRRLIRELSGGQRQRALIARALIGRPNALFMDEPFSFLDYVFHRKQRDLFDQWQGQFSLFLVEHDLNVIVNQVDWIVLLGRNKTLCGKTAEVLTPEALSEAYGVPLHLHQEANGEIQIHFL